MPTDDRVGRWKIPVPAVFKNKDKYLVTDGFLVPTLVDKSLLKTYQKE